MTVTGDDPKKFAAAMVEYSKEKVRNIAIVVLSFASNKVAKNIFY